MYRPLLALTLSGFVGAVLAADPPAAADYFAPPDTIEREIQFTADDGVVISGTLMLPRSSDPQAPAKSFPVVVLLHPIILDRDAMGELAYQLVRDGVGAVLLDLRGHGKSRQMADGRHLYAFPLIPWTDFHKTLNDLRSLIGVLGKESGVDMRRLGLAGAGEGALMASEAAARLPDFRLLVMIDPTEPAAGFDPSRDLSTLGARPALLVASAFAPSQERIAGLAEYGSGERTLVKDDVYAKTSRLLTPGAKATLETARWCAQKLAATR